MCLGKKKEREMKYSKLLILCLLALSCQKIERGESTTLSLDIGTIITKSTPPNEDKISDLNIFVFNQYGELEDRYYLKGSSIELEKGRYSCKIRLLNEQRYDIYVMANLGYKPSVDNLEELKEYKYWLSRPDDFSGGVPMSGAVKGIVAKTEQVEVPLTRAIAKISLKLDKGRLAENVSFNIASVTVGNCPRAMTIFGKGKVDSEYETFPVGFSGEKLPLVLYLLENIDSQDYPSFIEIKADYDSDLKYSKPGEYLVYRCYIGDDIARSVERNCHYSITIIPEGDGLGEADTPQWRIDKSSLSTHYNGTPKFVQHPADYIECRIGDTLHLWCDVYPPDTPFTIDPSNIENDTGLGLYEYDLDPDGFGITMYMKKGGTSHIYMEAGPPIDDAALYVIICEP